VILTAPWLIDYALDTLGHGRDAQLRETLRNASLLDVVQRHTNQPPVITIYTAPGPRVPPDPLQWRQVKKGARSGKT
jgi:hypothetical protein